MVSRLKKEKGGGRCRSIFVLKNKKTTKRKNLNWSTKHKRKQQHALQKKNFLTEHNRLCYKNGNRRYEKVGREKKNSQLDLQPCSKKDEKENEQGV